MCVCCTEDKKGGVDRSSTVIAKEPEGKANSRDREMFRRFDVSTFLLLCITYVIRVCTYIRIHVYTYIYRALFCERPAIALASPIRVFNYT